ncbi:MULTISPECIES: DUF7006 family protein [unclassified Enterococcus]|uniref:DUF7006 family protein n=1 Tax=unclassified Enterococcus TaxID=2608891 RepID=UPI0019090493|nr:MULTISPECIES: hypothetical protein [unclassified Enterococcus]MBK0039229.1 hypothetical protein [Enterococcus sp. S52]MBK0071877.1 hypothetical protein [Enterococcus sp. S53]MBK0142469.1 hypothetical protein [Enterococcus sp. S76]MBK0146164.1 hypothetical protein [Enterococcus sp. S77]
MTLFTTKTEYMNYFKNTLIDKNKEREELEEYLNKQFRQLEQLIKTISEETFWQVFPKILGIDAKLNLMIELIPFEDFSNDEIIRLAENDYRDYFKELCGFNLKKESKHAMFFNII